MATKKSRVTKHKDRQLVRDGIPVQVYVPKEVYVRFKRKYRYHGAVSKLVRQAFLMAIAEPEDMLPPAQSDD